MRVRTQAALASLALLALCGAAQAKPTACGCHLLTKNVRHTVIHHAMGQTKKTVHARAAHNDTYTMHRRALQRDERYATQERESQIMAWRQTRNDYDYYDAREANEDIYNTRQTYRGEDEQYAYRQDSYASGDYRAQADGPPATLNGQDRYRQDDYSYGYGSAYGQSYGPSVTLNSRDFSGGVGYGQSGDLGYYQGGYGRFDPYNGNTAGMNGMDRARMSVWHGYNGHNGLGNGY